MKESFWGYFIVSLGIIILVIMLLVQRLTTTSEEDYYLLREVLESSMIDAVDYGSYRSSGRLVMSEEKFEEVFIRRFSESVINSKTYIIDFYNIYEEPPKATVRLRTKTGEATVRSDSVNINIDTMLTGILESKNTVSNIDVANELVDRLNANCIKEDYWVIENYIKNINPDNSVSDIRSDVDALLKKFESININNCRSNKGTFEPFKFTYN